MTTTQDIAMLCAAIDEGDDTALLPLADALEEAGDPRAAGIKRLPVGRAPAPSQTQFPGWVWVASGKDNKPAYACIHDEVLNRLKGRNPRILHAPARGWQCGYPTRSAAFLALAEALVDG